MPPPPGDQLPAADVPKDIAKADVIATSKALEGYQIAQLHRQEGLSITDAASLDAKVAALLAKTEAEMSARPSNPDEDADWYFARPNADGEWADGDGVPLRLLYPPSERSKAD